MDTKRARFDKQHPVRSLSRCTELIFEEYDKLPETMPHFKRWDQAYQTAKENNPVIFGSVPRDQQPDPIPENIFI